MEDKIHILLFYKYVEIEDPDAFRKEHLQKCKEIGLLGRILVAQEGINGSVSGSVEQIEKYKEIMWSDSRFNDLVFKEDMGLMHPFKKMIVKTKKEIVNFGVGVNMNNSGKYLTPKEFLELYKSDEEIVILDARNEYEAKVGKFKNATILPIKTFREFPEAVKKIENLKDKKIVTYCTGGIRCEKASAYLKDQGFTNVSQLKGGILTFAKEFPDSVWEGRCFVFDKRLVSKVNSGDDLITNCEICGIKCDLYKNCRHNACDKYCSICINCDAEYAGCCSKNCFNIFMKERMVKVSHP